MFSKQGMKNILAARGYRHCQRDDVLTRHGQYARNMQYAFSKEFNGPGQRFVDVVFLSADLCSEKLVIGFCRENLSIENGILEDSEVRIPLAKFSLEKFEKQLDRLIPRGSPLREKGGEIPQF